MASSISPGVSEAPLARESGNGRASMSIVIGGHVDHGKSTIIGRLLADTGSLPEGKLEQVKALCERTARPFEYAFLLDALKDEQAQGITIDAARVFFKTGLRDYIILDAPGHIEFLKNMVTGASRAEAALLVIDAKEGVQENSRRHGYMMSMLGISQIAILVNKMDLVDYDRGVFETIEREYRDFLGQIGVEPACFIPVSGREGDMIAEHTPAMEWYEGPTVLDVLDQFRTEPPPVNLPFRMPVQDVYKFTRQGDDRRIVSGTVDTGTLHVGDEVVFYPSGKRSRVRSIEGFNTSPKEMTGAGEATGFTLEEQIYVSRGELAARAGEARPHVTTRLRVSLFWLGREPMELKKDYTLKLGSARVPVRLEEIHRVIDASDLAATTEAKRINRHDVAECTLKLNRAMAFDLADQVAATSRFVIVDNFEIRGGGIVREDLPDRQTWVRNKVLLRNYKWERSMIPTEHRARQYSQKAGLLLVTGADEAERKRLGKDLESRLFAEGRVVYYLGIGNVVYGVDADIESKEENRGEHLRRLAEVANIMLDAGVILVVTAAELTQEDLEIVKTTVDPERIETIWVGEQVTTDLMADVLVGNLDQEAERLDRITRMLEDKGMIFRPW